MRTSSSQPDELSELLIALTDGDMNQRQFAHLQSLLSQDADAQTYFRQYMRLCALLEFERATAKGEQSELRGDGNGSSAFGISDFSGLEPPLPNPPFCSLSTTHYPPPTTPFVGSWAFSCMVSAVIMGVMLLGFWAYKITHHQHIVEAPSQSAPSEAMPEMVFVGRITGAAGVKWSDDPNYLPPLGFGAVPLGRKYKFDCGLMEITYDSGAKVILQGPCTYEVESTAGGYLALGKLTARLGERGEGRGERAKTEGGRRRAEGGTNLQISKSPNPESSALRSPPSAFVVRTPTAVITDLGTEFGVEVDKAGVTESYVFAGKVRLAAVGRQAENVADRVLLAGQAGRVNGERVVVAAADGGGGSRFVRELPVRKAPPEPLPEVELIGQVDYSDTWTAHSPARSGGYVPLESPEALRVEQCHGNPPRSWVFSAPTAVTTWPSGALSGSWPGFPARGAKSGFTERCSLDGVCYLGFEYGLRDDFVVQFDAVQTDDRINVTIGDEPATIAGARSLSVFFRAPRTPRAPRESPHHEIGLYTPSKGEVDTRLHSGIPAPFQWHNYAVRFNLREKRLTVWVDGNCLGTIDLAGVALAAEAEGQRTWADLPWTGQYVTVGGYSENAESRVWTDNFRLGALAKDLVPEKPVTKGEQNHDLDVTK